MPAATSGIISKLGSKLEEEVGLKLEEEVKRRGIRQIMSFHLRMQKKEQRPSEKLFRRLSLHLFGQGNWVRWHPLVMGEPWK